MPQARWKFWRQKSKRGSLYNSMDARGSSLPASGGGSKGGMGDQTSSLSAEEIAVQILRIQQRLKIEKKKTQDKRLQRQMQLDNLQSRKRKKEYDFKLKLSSTPWNTAEYHRTLRRAFGKESFPTSKKYLDEAIKVLKQEHTTLLHERLAKLLSTQNNEELMLVMGSIPNLKEELTQREEKIRNVVIQVEGENRQLKNVLHYKVYIMTKMKDKLEIGLATKLSLNRAISDLQSIDGSLQNYPRKSNQKENNGKHSHLSKLNQPKRKTSDDDGSLDNDNLFLPHPTEPPPEKPLLAAAKKALQQQQEMQSRWLESGQDQQGMQTLPMEEHEDGGVTRSGSLLEEHLRQQEEAHTDDTVMAEQTSSNDSCSRQSSYESDEKSIKSLQRQKAQLARQQLEARRKKRKPKSPHSHLQNMNQPARRYSDDEHSLDDDQLFDAAPEGPPPRKPLLAAARKAEAQRLQQKTESARKRLKEKRKQQQAFSHLKDLNQPKNQPTSDDEKSLDDDQLFDDLSTEPPPAKPLLAAAKKARNQQQERMRRAELASKRIEERQKQRQKDRFSHLNDMNQPKREVDDDDGSLGDADLFEPPKEPPPSKPLLAAAKKAQAQRERERRQQRQNRPFSHLEDLNQPKEEVSDDDGSLGDADLFEPPKEPPPSKPLLAAAKKAQAQRERERRQQRQNRPFSHLEDLNQPKEEVSDDEGSLGDGKLFHPPKEPPSAKPLLAAARKAQAQREREIAEQKMEERRRQRSKQPFSHLQELNQPKQEVSDDDGSLGDADLFDPPKETPPAKPLLAAAKKAQAQRQRECRQQRQNQPFSHLQELNQPKQEVSDDDCSLEDGDLFDPPKESPSDKPLLAAAKKAQAQQQREIADKREKEAFCHLHDLNQPKSASLEEDDDVKSLDADQLFNEPETEPPPRRPLIAAAKRAKEHMEKQKQGGEGFTDSSRSGRSLDSSTSSDVRRRIEERRLRRQKQDGPKESSISNDSESKQSICEGRDGELFDHLNNLNQPTITRDDDNNSLDDDELFLRPDQEPRVTKKPLVEAAKKARQQQEREVAAQKRLEERRRQREDKRGASDYLSTSDRIEQQRQKAEAARKRLDERRKRRQGGSTRTGTGVRTDSNSSFGSGFGSCHSGASSAHSRGSSNHDSASSIEGPSSATRTPTTNRGRTPHQGATPGSAIERSRARRARMTRSRSTDAG